eukprot:TRINITY_DN3968_c1_g2_i1.p1 TRINITY_DN3968_c1_g2~~TRINITY_DN3968_c1_g2_i1.p1  ORF type:complete len:434 (+),score=119.67 TRINITY_DN3968_c1_g2_i1:57-1304(+)
MSDHQVASSPHATAGHLSAAELSGGQNTDNSAGFVDWEQSLAALSLGDPPAYLYPNMSAEEWEKQQMMMQQPHALPHGAPHHPHHHAPHSPHTSHGNGPISGLHPHHHSPYGMHGGWMGMAPMEQLGMPMAHPHHPHHHAPQGVWSRGAPHIVAAGAAGSAEKPADAQQSQQQRQQQQQQGTQQQGTQQQQPQQQQGTQQQGTQQQPPQQQHMPYYYAAPGAGATVCRHFLKGQCKFGVRCRYSHNAAGGASGVPHSPSSDPSQQAQLYDNGAAMYYNDGYYAPSHHAHHSAPPQHHHQPSPHYYFDPRTGGYGIVSYPPPRGDTNQVPCRYFKLGSCRYGEQCRFSHEAQPATSAGDTHHATYPTTHNTHHTNGGVRGSGGPSAGSSGAHTEGSHSTASSDPSAAAAVEAVASS